MRKFRAVIPVCKSQIAYRTHPEKKPLFTRTLIAKHSKVLANTDNCCACGLPILEEGRDVLDI